MLTAGNDKPVVDALKRLLAMRHYKRSQTVDGVNNTDVLEQVGLDEHLVEDMYKYMAIANYEDRFVIPTNHRELSTEDAYGERSGCGFNFGDGCHTQGVSRTNLFGSKSPRQREHAQPVSVWSPSRFKDSKETEND